MSPPMNPRDPNPSGVPVPVHQALTADELLGVLPGDAPVEPGLGAVDGCGELVVRHGGEPPPGAGTPPYPPTSAQPDFAGWEPVAGRCSPALSGELWHAAGRLYRCVVFFWPCKARRGC